MDEGGIVGNTDYTVFSFANKSNLPLIGETVHNN